MSTTSRDERRPGPGAARGAERGFTLLEALCAFFILALVTAQISQIFWNNVRKGAKALSHRELREAADTIFRKMIYEWEAYDDGESRTLDEEYGEFADLQGWQRDRWAAYRYELEKKPQSVVGTSPDGEEGLFEEDTDTAYPEETGEDAATAEGEADAVVGVELVRITLRIFRTEEAGEDPLLTLTTWIDPDRGKTGR